MFEKSRETSCRINEREEILPTKEKIRQGAKSIKTPPTKLQLINLP